MDLEQKFTEETVNLGFDTYNLSFAIMDYMNYLPGSVQVGMIKLFDKIDYKLFTPNDDEYRTFGGVVKTDTPFFFSIILICQENKIPIYIDIEQIELDDYLDYVTSKQTLRNYDRTN